MTLEPGEFHIYTDVRLERPEPEFFDIKGDPSRLIPNTFAPDQNHPNPFNVNTQIDYALPKTGDMSLIVYDLLGREVKTLIQGMNEAGNHSVNWDGTDHRKETIASGVYLYTLTTQSGNMTKKMLLLK